MTNKHKGKAALAGAIGSAAIAAALMYANKRKADKEEKKKEDQHEAILFGEKPETD